MPNLLASSNCQEFVCQLRDQIAQGLSMADMGCMSCSKHTHLIHKCPLITASVDPQSVIAKDMHSIFQPRSPFLRKRAKEKYPLAQIGHTRDSLKRLRFELVYKYHVEHEEENVLQNINVNEFIQEDLFDAKLADKFFYQILPTIKLDSEHEVQLNSMSSVVISEDEGEPENQQDSANVQSQRKMNFVQSLRNISDSHTLRLASQPCIDPTEAGLNQVCQGSSEQIENEPHILPFNSDEVCADMVRPIPIRDKQMSLSRGKQTANLQPPPRSQQS